jgi:glycosyltransferase involved in cell wall biosynthesis
MRLLILTHSLPPSGGAQKVAWELAKESAKKYETHIITYGKIKEKIIIDNVTVHFLPQVKHSLRFYLTTGKKEIIKLYREISPDIINAHGITVFSHVLRKQKRVKKIATFHHSYPQCYQWSKIRQFKFNYFFKKTINNYEILTTVSKHMQEYFVTTFKKKVLLIENGYNDIDFYLLSNIKRERKSILFVGQLTIAKGVDILFKLANLLPEYEFYFAGGYGALKNSIKSKNIHFLGAKIPEELNELYNTCEYSIFPSKYENFPLVGIEAMSCGSIVIASNKGFDQYINNRENGFIIKEPDEYKILKVLLENKDIEAIRKKALETIKEFSWKQIFERYLKLYEN